VCVCVCVRVSHAQMSQATEGKDWKGAKCVVRTMVISAKSLVKTMVISGSL